MKKIIGAGRDNYNYNKNNNMNVKEKNIDFINETEEKFCLCCKRKIVGRSDKKFCSDECRTLYNNRKYRGENKEMTKIDRILKKNRSILNTLYSKGITETTTLKLFGLGFDFDFMTSIKKNSDKDSFGFGCYEYTYNITRKGTIELEREEITRQ